MNKIISLSIKVLSICLLIYFLIGISKGIYKNKKDIALMREKINENEKVNKDLMNVEKNMIQRINNLKDPREIEKIAREVLNMKKADEEVYRIINKKDN